MAELNIWLALSVLRGAVRASGSVASGEWAHGGKGGGGLFSGLGASLAGKTVGLLGMGSIGLATVRRLAGFGVREGVYVSRTDKQ